jgi:hypothetical protein
VAGVRSEGDGRLQLPPDCKPNPSVYRYLSILPINSAPKAAKATPPYIYKKTRLIENND